MTSDGLAVTLLGLFKYLFIDLFDLSLKNTSAQRAGRDKAGWASTNE
jgi:hypothetical protein